MRKTRSFIGKILLAALVLLIIAIPFMPSASAIYIDQVPVPTVYMDHFRIEGSLGDDVIVYLKIADVQNSGSLEQGPVFSFQAGLRFDADEVTCTAVQEGGFLTNNGADTVLSFPGTIDNVNGIVTAYGWSLTDVNKAKFGSGILVNFTFHINTGLSDIHIADFTALSNDGVTELEVKTNDYFTAQLGGGSEIVKIVSNPVGSDSRISDQLVTQINTDIGGTTYKGNLTFTITSPDADLLTHSNFGFINVTIPKTLMDCTTGNEWVLYVNGGLEGGRTVASNSTHTSIYREFTYPPSKIVAAQILSTIVVPEFSSVFFATLLVLATFAAAIFGSATWSYKRKK